MKVALILVVMLQLSQDGPVRTYHPGEQLRYRLTQTEMLCPEPAMAFEREAGALFRSNIRVERIGGERLRLVSEAGTIELRRAI